MDAWCSPVAAGGLAAQDDSLASRTYSLALQEISFFLFLLLTPLKM